MSALKTPLHALHSELGARMVEFAGWEMPVSYPMGVKGEHLACRTGAALFDVSHMAQVELHGDAAEALERLVPAALTSLPMGKARYTFFTNDVGGILDDLIVTRTAYGLFAVVNAACRNQDITHMQANLPGIEVRELTDRALIALQGPKAEHVLASLAPDAASLKFMEMVETQLMGANARISRLGYTGEDGFEISVPAERAEEIARTLLAHPQVEAAGLGARDSLRTEAGLCLYGQDITADTSPIEAGLTWAIQKRRREEGGFPGAARIQAELASGPARRLVGLRPEGRAPARIGTEIQGPDGKVIGTVTSGTFSPSLEAPISIGYVTSPFAEPGASVNLMVRGKAMTANVTALPFVSQNYKR